MQTRNDIHAHSLYLHELATTGLVGLALAGSALGLIALRTWRGSPTDAYAAGTFWAFVTWLVGAAFDCYELNGTMFGLFAVIASLALMPTDSSES